MLEDNTQPFFVGLNNPRFPTARNGYLPALEPKEIPEKDDKQEPVWSGKQWDIVNQLRGMVKFLYLKETERRADASKRRPTDISKLTNIYRGVSGNENGS